VFHRTNGWWALLSTWRVESLGTSAEREAKLRQLVMYEVEAAIRDWPVILTQWTPAKRLENYATVAAPPNTGLTGGGR
jgi:hypothetical protein